MDRPELDIQHDLRQRRFICSVDGHVCSADYVLEQNVMQMTHTGVHPSLQGRGIAAQLVQAALQFAREQGLRVQPLCSYVAVYMRRHPETQDLLA